ncbi:conserved hypothetical protein [Renibacterium salmoninarum ATCC 33209]|uniref:Barstar (barnase inhibitor) domain-containing protein n=1 Tax=Renibacterium salmoninarum (strain ATCC 33209 / DSM 20767 / JCM 11484 / NBRC 15589 / NCIMB 2235) TaxID=288705 RepID=A9WLY8_RENSM|nr:barstar family protein [Renibacterium salmoninarum]ABY22169.1 conserved hypothetical protein [Renibacterium salmoninarum ATCC 33209]
MTTPSRFEIPAAESKEGVLDAFARALNFPKHFGHNFDALADCLRDFADAATVPVTLVWHVDPTFKATRAHRIVLEILAEVAEASKQDSPKSTLTFIEQNSSVEDYTQQD